MGRPPAINDRQKAEILRRLALGEKPSALRKEYRLSETTFRRNFSADVSKVREVGTALASAELSLASLPLSAQVSARNLADQLKGMQLDYMAGASKGLKTATILQDLAHRKAGLLDPETIQTDDLRLVAALAETANKSASMGTTLLTTNKGKDPLPGAGDDLFGPEQILRMAKEIKAARGGK